MNQIIYYSNGYKDRVDYQKAQETFLALVKKTHGTWTRYQTSGTSYL